MNTYDYIIVGAGSAGCVLANRLSEDEDVSVLVLEAGGKANSVYINMPLAWREIRLGPKFNWNYRSEPEPYLGGRQVILPRGKVLGGSSSVNGMLYLRGHPRDYDLWRQAGCTGWSYADTLPYFKRAEGTWRDDGDFHSQSGPLGITAIDTRRLGYESLSAAVKNAGIPYTEDFNGANPEGFSKVDMTVKDGRRASAARMYLVPAMARPNLTVEINALTQRVVVQHGRAVGVRYAQNGEMKEARAAREVILSSGSYNSPQVLLLSGIGPPDEMAEHGIEAVHELPGVGKNLSEHANCTVHFATKNPDTFIRRLRMDRVALSVLQWGLFKTGDMANQPLTGMAFVRSLPELERPDLQLFFNSVRMDAKLWFPLIKKSQGHMLEAYITMLHPESRGAVTLRSADPADPPRILFNLLQADADIATLRRGIRMSREIYATPPLRDRIARETTPGPDVTSDADLDAYIRKIAAIVHHPVGTCAMGEGPGAVVDTELRVHGLEALRVVDASVMPTVPGGNTNAPTIMIAERAADLIRGRTPLAPEEVAWTA